MDFLTKYCSFLRHPKFVVVFILFLILSIVIGCNSSSTEQSQNNSQISKTQADDIEALRNQMFKNDLPENHIRMIRDYVFETYPDLPDDVVTLINNTKPKIVNNENEMEYAFFWTLTDGSILEVVTTPPPLCEPISCHKEKRLTYP